jgi:hypothetical protein
LREDNNNFTFFGVNEAYCKKYSKENNVIFEYELEKYNPFLQKRGYMETSVYLHVYWNKLYQNKEMIGFSQYDMKHYQSYNYLDKDTIYLLNSGHSILNNKQWNDFMFPNIRNLDFLRGKWHNYVIIYNRSSINTWTVMLDGVEIFNYSNKYINF